jgi:hypothetical protein
MAISWPRRRVNRDKFEQNYNNPVLTADDRIFFQKASQHPDGPRKLLVIAEAWCGDVYRELPTAVRIAESAGIDLRIFLRDENPDIMDEFLSNNGKSRAIPVFVFYTATQSTLRISPNAPRALTLDWRLPWNKRERS